MVSNTIFDYGLNTSELSVYFCLIRYADNRTLTCFPSQKTIATNCHISRITVNKALATLESKGLITSVVQKRENGSLTSKLYRIKRLIPTIQELEERSALSTETITAESFSDDNAKSKITELDHKRKNTEKQKTARHKRKFIPTDKQSYDIHEYENFSIFD